jgi:hypothetical protein
MTQHLLSYVSRSALESDKTFRSFQEPSHAICQIKYTIVEHWSWWQNIWKLNIFTGGCCFRDAPFMFISEIFRLTHSVHISFSCLTDLKLLHCWIRSLVFSDCRLFETLFPVCQCDVTIFVYFQFIPCISFCIYPDKDLLCKQDFAPQCRLRFCMVSA